MNNTPETCKNRVYQGANSGLLSLVRREWMDILDVGCGAGENAEALKATNPSRRIFGITMSPEEQALARPHMDRCWVADIERELPAELEGKRFDAILFSHILEHLKQPASALARFTGYVKDGGYVLISLPNILFYRQRITFLFGRFEYEKRGPMDATHLRFFTYRTAGRYLIAPIPELTLVKENVQGNFPLNGLRLLFGKQLSAFLDRLGCRLMPNLFGREILIEATKSPR